MVEFFTRVLGVQCGEVWAGWRCITIFFRHSHEVMDIEVRQLYEMFGDRLDEEIDEGDVALAQRIVNALRTRERSIYEACLRGRYLKETIDEWLGDRSRLEVLQHSQIGLCSDIGEDAKTIFFGSICNFEKAVHSIDVRLEWLGQPI
jgi:hypothetical protein